MNTEKNKKKSFSLKTQYWFLKFPQKPIHNSGNLSQCCYNYIFNPQTLNGRRRTFFMRRLVIAISESFPIFLEAESVLVQFCTKFKLNPNVGGGMRRRGGGEGGYPPSWFSLNNSETVKAVTLAFCSIQQHFIRYVHAKVGILNLLQTPDIEHNSDGGVPDARISGQFLIKGTCHSSRTSDDIDMKLGQKT